MKLLQKFLNRISGLQYPQEYLCLAKESFLQPLQVWLAADNRFIKNITNDHLFTGYSPLIITTCTDAADSRHPPDNIDIYFGLPSRQPNEFPGKKDALAHLSLKLIFQQAAGENNILYYEGIHGEHRFLSSFHQYIISLNNRLYNKKTGNIFLHDNLYKQVQIAYAVPRVISLITVSDGQSFNLFPTDLHGPVNDQYYVCSLRHEGKACNQVETARRIVISQVHADTFKTVYSLGRNHMQELKPKDNFPLGELKSQLLQLPLPQRSLNYREMELEGSFKHGIHKLLLFKVLHRETLRDDAATLAHIHTVYASWRYNNGLSGNYFFR